MVSRYGTFDTSQFGDLELRCYTLIKSGLCTKTELSDGTYTLDEFLKLYALYAMDRDIERIQADELQEGGD